MDEVRAHGREIAAYGLERLARAGRAWRSTAPPTSMRAAAWIAFNLDGVHPHDVAECSTARASHARRPPLRAAADAPPRRRGDVARELAVHSTREDVDRLIDALGAVREVFG